MTSVSSDQTRSLGDKFTHALEQLEQARPFNKARYQNSALEVAGRLLQQDGGNALLHSLAPRYDKAGLFAGTDWDNPGILLPNLVRSTLESGVRQSVGIELLSLLRMLALCQGHYQHPGVSAEQARHFLNQVLALNLNLVFGSADEAQRTRLGRDGAAILAVFRYLLDNVGYADILQSLIDEIWRILSQRPIQVDHVKSMITQIAIAHVQGLAGNGDTGLGADRLVSALFGPTQGSVDDPGLAAYQERLDSFDQNALQQEAGGFARAMRDVGLVSDYHAVFLQWLLGNEQSALIPDALGLSSTGLDALRSYQQLVHKLIEEAVQPATAQCAYSLTMMLESGILYMPPIAPALWRQIDLALSPYCEQLMIQHFGDGVVARRRLLAGTIALLGQPLGVGQGNNPTCQSARALSMWACNDPDYLLHLIAHCARFDQVEMHFEGQPIDSAQLLVSPGAARLIDNDPVSVLLVPHLDRIYHEMGRLCLGRNDDPHRWINPEFHGWWVGREFFLAVDIHTGQLHNYQQFVERFYRSYHPLYNGNQPIIRPQPAGLAVTDSQAQFVGWHAISLLRIALDQNGVMRVYFFNPNNDSGQNWGNGVVVSTHGNGERYGEASLPFPEMASRLYIFHDDGESFRDDTVLDTDEIEAVRAMAAASWAAQRLPPDTLVAEADAIG